jgi:uncharacterized PurR-regulated membrane protein YhhQ (DUF165 family)
MSSLQAAVLFVLLNLPVVYQLTNKFLGNTWDAAAQCPTSFGVLLHAGVFFLLSFLMMKKSGLSKADKMKSSLTGALLFAILSSPMAYKMVRNVLPMVASESGCPSMAGVLVHGGVYTVALMGLQSLKL